jgi:hypothetical protein
VNRYLFEYTITSTGKTGEFSWASKTEEDARVAVQAKVADFEFLDDIQDVVVGKLLSTRSATGDNYYECEGCGA